MMMTSISIIDTPILIKLKANNMLRMMVRKNKQFDNSSSIMDEIAKTIIPIEE